ncbi:MAG: hypothetical protein R3A50_04860 [Saprospiraceae bacterium]
MQCKESKPDTHDPEKAKLYEDLLGIYADLRLFLFALEYQSEMEYEDRQGVPFTGCRIADRLQTIVGELSGPYA